MTIPHDSSSLIFSSPFSLPKKEIYLPSEDLYYMTMALAKAKEAFAQGEVPVGCVVVRNHRVMGTGFNQVETLNDPTAHAEVIAITQASKNLCNWRLDGAILYTTLEPCLLCTGAIFHSRIARVVWGAPEPHFGADGSKYDLLSHHKKECGLHAQIEVERYLLASESSALLQEFFHQRRQ